MKRLARYMRRLPPGEAVQFYDGTSQLMAEICHLRERDIGTLAVIRYGSAEHRTPVLFPMARISDALMLATDGLCFAGFVHRRRGEDPSTGMRVEVKDGCLCITNDIGAPVPIMRAIPQPQIDPLYLSLALQRIAAAVELAASANVEQLCDTTLGRYFIIQSLAEYSDFFERNDDEPPYSDDWDGDLPF